MSYKEVTDLSEKSSQKGRNSCIMRPYILEDIPFICAGIEKYLPELPNYKNITVSKDRIAYLLKHNFGNVSSFQAWVLVDPKTNQLVGGGAGYCVPGMFTWDLVANDVFLFILPEWRSLRNVLMVMTAYKEWAKARGAKLIMASQIGGYRTEDFAKIMERQGYIAGGYQWMLRLDEAYLNRV